MFKLLACRKNTFLHYYHSDLERKTWFPREKSHNEAPISKNIHPTGLNGFALPKILTKLYDINIDRQIKALNTVYDELKKSKSAQKQSQILKHVKVILKQSIRSNTGEAVIVICNILKLVAEKEGCAHLNVFDYELISNLLVCVETAEDAVRLEASNVLEFAVKFERIESNLLVGEVGQKFLRRILSILFDDHKENEHLYHFLAHFLQNVSQDALQLGYFEVMLNKLRLKDKYLAVVLKCFAALINNYEGQELCDAFVVLKDLDEILSGTGFNTDVYEFAAMTLQNCTHSFLSRMMIINYKCLPNSLISHAQTGESESLQIYCLQSLMQIAENISVKEAIRKEQFDEVKKIKTQCETAGKIKANLIGLLNNQIF